jgi:two-component system, LytTR family, response regulator
MKYMETMKVNYTIYQDELKDQVLVLPTCKGAIAISVQQIIRIQSISNYSKLFLSDGKSVVVAKVLHWFQERSCLCSFVRVHRTHFVNSSYIKSYSGSKAGLLFLENGEIISVAKRKKAGLAARLHNLNNSLAGESAYTSPFNKQKILAA